MTKNKRLNTPLIAILLLITAVSLFFIGIKESLFLDEIYTLGLSNSHEAGFLSAYAGGSYIDKTLDRSDFITYLTVEDDDRFDFASVYHNQENDVHPPLYYWMINIIYSFFPGCYSKWPALIAEMFIHILNVYLLYTLARKLFRNGTTALLTAVLYGLSTAGISTMVMMRMYILSTLFTILLAHQLLIAMEDPKWHTWPSISLCIFMGLMSHYYYVFYAFFACLACLIYLIVKKRYREAGIFTVFGLLGVVLMVLAFPAVIDHMLGDGLVSGGNAVSNIKDIAHIPHSMLMYLGFLGFSIPVPLILALLIVIGMIMNRTSEVKDYDCGVDPEKAEIITIPAATAFVAVTVVAPLVAERYIWNLCPMLVLGISFMLTALRRRSSFSPKLDGNRLLVIIAVIAVITLGISRPSNLMLHVKAHEEKLESHYDAPCIFLARKSDAAVTMNMLQLMNFEDVFITDDPGSMALAEYMAGKEDADECILYMDVDEFWSSGFSPEEMLPLILEKTGYEDAELLYTFGLTQTYLLKK